MNIVIICTLQYREVNRLCWDIFHVSDLLLHYTQQKHKFTCSLLLYLSLVCFCMSGPSSSCTFTLSSVTTSYMLGQTPKSQEKQNVITSQRVWWNMSPDNSLVTWLGVKRIIQSVCELQALRWKHYPQMTVKTLNKPDPETLFPSLSSFKLDWGDGVNSPVIWRGNVKFFMEIKDVAFLSNARWRVVDVFSGKTEHVDPEHIDPCYIVSEHIDPVHIEPEHMVQNV